MYFPRKRKFWSVAIGHLTNDIFMASGTILLTYLSGTILPMSNTQIGLAVGVKNFAGALTQPFFGLRADKTGGRGIGAGGLAWVVVMYMVALLAAIYTGNYWLMFIPFVLQGFGSAALHPVGALHATESESERAATATAYFFLMGQVGLAFGPVLVGALLTLTTIEYGGWVGFPAGDGFQTNFSPIFLMGLFAIPVIILMFTGIPANRENDDSGEFVKEKVKVDQKQKISWKPFIVIAVMVLFRSLGQPGSVDFIPLLFQQKGWTPAEYGAIVSSFWIASAIMGVVFGNLADRFDRRLVVMLSLVLSAPAFFFLPVLDGYGAFALSIIAGGLSGGSHSIIVVLAQELIPDSKGFATGAILGFIFGSGALGSIAIGMVSDAVGLSLTFQMVAVTIFISGLLGLLLPKRAAG